MRKGYLAGMCVLLALGVSGCNNAAKHEAVFKSTIEQLNELTDALESIKDRASARAAAVRINKVCDRLKELAKEAQGLPRLRKAEDKRLLEKYEWEIRKTRDRLETAAFTAARKSGGDPDYLKAAERLVEVGKDFEKLGTK